MTHFRGKWATAAALGAALVLLATMGGGVLAGTPPASAPNGPAATGHTQVWVVRVYYRSTAERDRLAVELGAEEMATRDGYLTVFADPDLYAHILKLGLRVEVDQQETARFNDPHLFGDTFYGGFKTVEEMNAFLAQEAAAHPTLAQVVAVGPSWCAQNPGTCTLPAPYNGYQQTALHITNTAIAGPKPVYWYEAGIHAREIAVPEVAALYIQWLLDGYDSNPDAHWLVDYQDTWVLPITNPDGHHIVESGGGGSSPYYQCAH